MAEDNKTVSKLSLDVEEITEYRCLQRGDHLAATSGTLGFKYYHHGIFLGHDKGVADFGADETSKLRAKPRVIDLFEFNGNRDGQIFRFIYPEGTCQAPETAAHLAEEVVSGPEIWGPYNLFTNNCEHFATRCKTGKAYSLQVAYRAPKLAKAAKGSAKTSFRRCIVL